MYRKPENIINQKWTTRLKEVLVQENNDSLQSKPKKKKSVMSKTCFANK